MKVTTIRDNSITCTIKLPLDPVPGFKEIMEYHPINQNTYKKLKKHYKDVIPFIGAGLSAEIYPTWKKSLYALCNNITNPQKKFLFETEIEQDTFIAASDISHYLGEFAFTQSVIDVFSEGKIIPYISQLLNMPVGILAGIFDDNPVITTNFDRILENTYTQLGNPFDFVKGPTTDSNILLNAFQQNKHVLYKIHGDIGYEDTDTDTLIFTKEQYNKYYQSNSVLVQNLSKWLTGKTMLFVGCGLCQDYTVTLLESLLKTEEYRRSLMHFAIIDCVPDDFDNRLSELGRLHILPIFFPTGNWDALTIILKQLFIDTALPQAMYEAYKEYYLYCTLNEHSFKEELFKYYQRYPHYNGFLELYAETLFIDVRNFQYDSINVLKNIYLNNIYNYEIQLIYIDVIFLAGERFQRKKDDCIQELESIIEKTTFQHVKVIAYHHCILLSEGIYQAEKYKELMDDACGDEWSSPEYSKFILAAQRHIDSIYDGKYL